MELTITDIAKSELVLDILPNVVRLSEYKHKVGRHKYPQVRIMYVLNNSLLITIIPKLVYDDAYNIYAKGVDTQEV